jgi:phage/plasmid primase-like uncharacterized protein
MEISDQTTCLDRYFASFEESLSSRNYKPGAAVRNGDLLVPGYDVNGKLWTVQYIKADGTKRFARESRKQGCFRVVGAINAAEGLQKLANSPVIAIAEGYATAEVACWCWTFIW